jgi:hypothetical protein
MANNVLRSVPDEKGFYFYRSLDAPLGVKANSLEQFLEDLKSVEPACLGKISFEQKGF